MRSKWLDAWLDAWLCYLVKVLTFLFPGVMGAIDRWLQGGQSIGEDELDPANW